MSWFCVMFVQMILQRYMDPNWLENSFPSWVQRCNDAMNAESVELLKEVTVLTYIVQTFSFVLTKSALSGLCLGI